MVIAFKIIFIFMVRYVLSSRSLTESSLEQLKVKHIQNDYYFICCYHNLIYIYRLLVKNDNYWKDRNVPHLKPEILFGNYREYILMKKYQGQVARKICEKFPNEPYIGTFYGTEPALIIQDLELVKIVLSTDFNYITGREITDYTRKESFTNLIFFQGGDYWKVLRQNLNPLYTPAKIKNMFPFISNCTNALETFLGTEIKVRQNINVKSLLAKYTMDCFISSSFGLNANCLKSNESRKNPFVIAGEQIFDTSFMRGFKMACRAIWPSVFYGLGFQMFDKNIRAFFLGLFNEVSKNRLKSGSPTNNFVGIISEWKKDSHITGLCYSNTGERKKVDIEVNDELLVGQCAGFFAGGFETTSTTLGFLLYEIAKNQHVQNQLIEEVDTYLKKNNGVIDYECVNELPYMEACINETLRLYPVLGVLVREVMDEYTLPTGLLLHKGNRIHIPVYHLQRHPDHFPEPEVFRPERFFGEEKKNIKRYSFLAFGEGPRMCIGLRFAKMPMHAGLLTIFKKYRIEFSEDTPLKLEFHPTGLTTQSTIDINLKFIRRNEQ